METGILKVLIFRKLVNNFDNDSSALVTQMGTIKFAMIGFRNCSAILMHCWFIDSRHNNNEVCNNYGTAYF